MTITPQRGNDILSTPFCKGYIYISKSLLSFAFLDLLSSFAHIPFALKYVKYTTHQFNQTLPSNLTMVDVRAPNRGR